jgi:hypothetical protein
MTASSSQLSQSRRTTRVGGFVEQIRPDDVAAPEQLRLVLGAADPHLPAGPAVRDEVKCGNRFGNVEWLGVGDGGDGDEADVTGRRRHPRRNEHGVGSTGEPSGFDFLAAAPLRREGVVKGHEVQQSAFGGGGQSSPVSPAGDRLGIGRVAPRLRMPAVAVERDPEMQMLRHGIASPNVFANAMG